jgi:hypothetical protein
MKKLMKLLTLNGSIISKEHYLQYSKHFDMIDKADQGIESFEQQRLLNAELVQSAWKSLNNHKSLDAVELFKKVNVKFLSDPEKSILFHGIGVACLQIGDGDKVIHKQKCLHSKYVFYI